MEEIKIAIIMPCTQPENIVNRALLAIQKQTKKNNIIIYLINDCSFNTKDEYQTLIQKYSDLNIKYFKTEKNSGPNIARNIGLDNCTEDYVMFHDDDDWLYDEYVIEKYIEIIKQNKNKNISAIHFSILEKKIDKEFLRSATEENKFWILGKIYYKNFLDKYNIRFNEKLNRRLEDLFFALQTYLLSIENNYNILNFDKYCGYILYHDKNYSTLTFNHTLNQDQFLYSKNMNINLFYDIIFYHEIMLFYQNTNQIQNHKKEILNILKYFFINCNNIITLLEIYGIKHYSQEELNNFKESIDFIVGKINKNIKIITEEVNNILNFSMVGYETQHLLVNNYKYFIESFNQRWEQLILQ